MSWNKQTINLSKIDFTIDLLDDLRIVYNLEVLGEVRGGGMNDSGNYKIRKLSFQDTVMIEQMTRSEDCDSDDYLESFKFEKGKEPKRWKLEKYRKHYYSKEEEL